jgi:hypothetical protein
MRTAIAVLALVLTATPAGAKTDSTADYGAVMSCTSIHLQLEGLAIGRTALTTTAVASIIDYLADSTTKGAAKRGRKIEKAANDAAQIKAVRDAASWCVKIGQPPF